MMFGMMIHMEHHQLILLASGDLISLGGHAGLGVAFAKKKGEMLSDICIYATACGHAGIGGGINAAIHIF